MIHGDILGERSRLSPEKTALICIPDLAEIHIRRTQRARDSLRADACGETAAGARANASRFWQKIASSFWMRFSPREKQGLFWFRSIHG